MIFALISRLLVLLWKEPSNGAELAERGYVVMAA
jgi:hypothetical protein